MPPQSRNVHHNLLPLEFFVIILKWANNSPMIFYCACMLFKKFSIKLFTFFLQGSERLIFCNASTQDKNKNLELEDKETDSI